MSAIKGPFNIRVYGILIYQDEVLITEEFRNGQTIIKFPGGGLEFGEGLIDCLKREFTEEFDLEIEVLNHFYTTDFFQVSAFDPSQQIVSVYYKVNSFYIEKLKQKKEMVPLFCEGEQVFHWIKLQEIEPSYFTFPIDKKVAGMILENTNKVQRK